MSDFDFQIERTLNFRHAGVTRQGYVRIGGMKYFPDRQRWGCQVSMDFLFTEPVWIEGEDQLDALRVSLLTLKEIVLGAKKAGWSVWWIAEFDDGWFV